MSLFDYTDEAGLDNAVEISNVALDMEFIPIPLNGKRPFLPRWQSIDLKKSLSIIEKRPDGNIGVLTGVRSGITVVDIDTKNKGVETWEEWTTNRPVRTMTVKTGGGGLHYYFQYEPEIKTTNHVNGVGIDIRNDGGQVVFIGSRHPETNRRYLLDPVSFDENGQVVLEIMPAWLKELLLSSQRDR